MPKKLPEDLAAKIESEIARHPDGVGINDLHTALADIVSRRTLQRRLASLIEQKRIRAEGDGRALKYHGGTGDVTVALQGVSVTASPGQVAAEVYVPVSADGDDIRAYVRQPIQGRKPVGYDRELLETYRPNETRYLSPEIREHLHNIGRSPAGERPAGTYARDILGRLLIDLSWASSRLEGNTYIRETVAEPDPLRLRYREALITVVSEIVRGLKSPGADQVRDVAATLVAREDLDQITDLALADLRNLHEGSVSRYRLRLSEYRAWQPMQQAGK